MAAFIMTLDFVQKHLVEVTNIPDNWNIKEVKDYYKLDFKMCGLSSLNWDAIKKADRGYTFRIVDPLADKLSAVINLNVSSNTLTNLDYAALCVMPELRVLNAASNQLTKYGGISVLQRLRVLDVSHNLINSLSVLQDCRLLVELDVSFNHILSLSTLPATLISLSILKIAGNQLVSLDGIQALPRLKELYCQKNALTDIHALCGTYGLQILDATDNSISSLPDTVTVFKALPQLYNVNLKGNPIRNEPEYRRRIFEVRSIAILDGEVIRPELVPSNRGAVPNRGPVPSILKPVEVIQPVIPMPVLPSVAVSSPESLDVIREAAKRAFTDDIALKKRQRDEQIRFYRMRIKEIEVEYEEYEHRRELDLEACLKHLDALPIKDMTRMSYDFPNPAQFNPQPMYAQPPVDYQPYFPSVNQPLPPVTREEAPAKSPSIDLQREWKRQRQHRPDYRSVRDTKDVLAFAKKELLRESGSAVSQ